MTVREVRLRILVVGLVMGPTFIWMTVLAGTDEDMPVPYTFIALDPEITVQDILYCTPPHKT